MAAQASCSGPCGKPYNDRRLQAVGFFQWIEFGG